MGLSAFWRAYDCDACRGKECEVRCMNAFPVCVLVGFGLLCVDCIAFDWDVGTEYQITRQKKNQKRKERKRPQSILKSCRGGPPMLLPNHRLGSVSSSYRPLCLISWGCPFHYYGREKCEAARGEAFLRTESSIVHHQCCIPQVFIARKIRLNKFAQKTKDSHGKIKNSQRNHIHSDA